MVRILQGVVGLSAWLCLQLAFRALGGIHETLAETLSTARFMRGNPWFRRFVVKNFIRSCAPLRFNVAGFYYVDKGMSLTIAAIILENTVNLLIAEQ